MAPFLTNQSKAFVYALVSNAPSHPLKAPRAGGSVAAARKKDRFWLVAGNNDMQFFQLF